MDANFCLVMFIATATLSACEFTPSSTSDGLVDSGLTPSVDAANVAVDASVRPDASAPSRSPPGGVCECDADCLSQGTNAGICIYGVCMTRATAECANGTQLGCPLGSRCWSWSATDELGPLCWPDCAAHACSGVCDLDDSCAPAEGSTCDPTCGSGCT